MRLLFVDDERNLLDGLKRMLRPMRREWDMSFALGAREALDQLEDASFDVVVTDMRMPEMSGAELLEAVREHHPGVTRIILSGHSERESAVRSAGIAHQFLAKPCDPQLLKSTIERTSNIRSLLGQSDLAAVVAELGPLPSTPESYVALNREITSPEPSLKAVSQIVCSDLGMSAKVLQLVNSAFFGLAKRVETIDQAVTLLGIDVIKSLVLSNSAFAAFQPRELAGTASQLWQHGTAVAAIAMRIAKAEHADKVVTADILQAAMLHDLGKLVLAARMPEDFKRALSIEHDELLPAHEAEARVFGTDHAHVGAYLLGLWGLSDDVVEALAFHHHPAACPLETFAPLVAVHAADCLWHERTGMPDTQADLFDRRWLEGLGFGARLSEWQSLAGDGPDQETEGT